MPCWVWVLNVQKAHSEASAIRALASSNCVSAPMLVMSSAESKPVVQGGAQNLERSPAPGAGPPGLPKFRASGQTINKEDKVSPLPIFYIQLYLSSYLCTCLSGST